MSDDFNPEDSIKRTSPKFGNSAISKEVWNRYYAEHYGKPLTQLVEEGIISHGEGLYAHQKVANFVSTNAKNKAWNDVIPNLPPEQRKFALGSFVEPVTGLNLEPYSDIHNFQKYGFNIGSQDDRMITHPGREKFLKLAQMLQRQEAIDEIRGNYPDIHKLLSEIESDTFKGTRDVVGRLSPFWKKEMAGRDTLHNRLVREVAVNGVENHIDKFVTDELLGKNALIHKFLSYIAPEYRPPTIPANLGEKPNPVFPDMSFGGKENLSDGNISRILKTIRGQGPFLIEGAGTLPMAGDAARLIGGGGIGIGEDGMPQIMSKSELSEQQGLPLELQNSYTSEPESERSARFKRYEEEDAKSKALEGVGRYMSSKVQPSKQSNTQTLIERTKPQPGTTTVNIQSGSFWAQ